MNEELRKYMRENGSKGGKARAENLDAAELTRIGRKGAQAMWKKRRAKPVKSKVAKNAKTA
ncbi:MAG: hypothetical protein LAP61_05790 [Acidobacteriia bacterium]|nr:hypothetical protein [Terriglobia bacterium]